MFRKSSKEPRRRFWSGHRLKRFTFALLLTMVSTSAWATGPTFVDRWAIGKLNDFIREETGLELKATELNFHVFDGTIVLQNISLGGDLLKADRLEVQVELKSLLGHNPHFYRIELVNPQGVLDTGRLSRIHLKTHPDKASTPLIRLDQLIVSGGKLLIEEPAWRLPHAEASFQIAGKGLGPNRVSADVNVPRLVLGTGPKAIDGNLDARMNLSDLSLELKEGTVNLGKNHILVHGNLAFKERVLATDVQGKVDLAESVKLFDPSAAATWKGTAEFKAGLRGALAAPAWNISLQGKGLSSPARELQPGSADLNADGNFEHANIRNLVWASSQGKLQASGQWKRGQGSQLQFRGERLGLELLASFVRVGFMERLSANLSGSAEIPGNPWVPPQWDTMKITASGQFLRDGQNVGQMTARMADGIVDLEKVVLKVPEVELDGRGVFRLGKKTLQSITASASAKTDAALVAEVLHHWDIGEGRDASGKSIMLGMKGRAIAHADMQWNPAEGFRMKGHADVENPQWHGAIMDQLHADVSIQDDELRIDNIDGEKGKGGAKGSLWLTWRKVPPGLDQIDMCFQAFQLPIEEGLRAGDVGDLPITGLGSGWARIHGPYNRLWVEASGLAEAGTAYGFRIPHASGDMIFDIAGDHLIVKDVRVAESVEQLGSPDEEPTGLLALHGGMDMDLKRETWQVWAKGNVDSMPLGLPSPRFQGQIEARFDGPWVSSFGPLKLPFGTFDMHRGRLFLDHQSLEGIDGHLESSANVLRIQVHSEDRPQPLLVVDARSRGKELTGSLQVHVAPDSVDTVHLAERLTNDLLKDGELDLTAEGASDEKGFHWQGQIHRLVAHFDGFDLDQQEPTVLTGDASGVNLDLRLQGQASVGPGKAIPGGAGLFQATGRIPFSPSAPADIKLIGAADLANLKGILDHVLGVDEFSLLGDLKPEGNAQFNLDLGGSLSKPALEGLLSLEGGRLQIRTYPQSVEDLSFNLHFHDQDIAILPTDPLQGRIAQGALKAWGTATWELGGLSVYDLQTRVENFQLRDLPEGFELYGDLNAVLQGTKEEGGILSGSIQARHMVYQADINLRDIILASALGGSSLNLGADPNDPLTHIDLDLDLLLSQPWEIDTNLLKVQGRPSGSFKILGTLAEPGLKGKMDILPGGRITNLLPAGDVVLERGTIEWTNTQMRLPTVDLQGRVDVSPYVINLGIRGTLDALEMKESSTPSLRQDEITALLIDPSLAATIGSTAEPTSQTAMNYGVASTGSGLVSTLALANLQETLRKTFNLDRVSVAWRTGTGTSGSEMSFTVGKNIDLFGHPTPLVFSHQRNGDTATTSGQMEWRFGNSVLLLGVSQSGTNGAAPSGEIRHTWSLGW